MDRRIRGLFAHFEVNRGAERPNALLLSTFIRLIDVL
jgi:hypothetical protein